MRVFGSGIEPFMGNSWEHSLNSSDVFVWEWGSIFCRRGPIIIIPRRTGVIWSYTVKPTQLPLQSWPVNLDSSYYYYTITSSYSRYPKKREWRAYKRVSISWFLRVFVTPSNFIFSNFWLTSRYYHIVMLYTCQFLKAFIDLSISSVTVK